MSVDTDSEAEGAQTEVSEGRAAGVVVTAAFPDGAQALETDTEVTVSVVGQGGIGQAGAEDFNPVDDFAVTILAGQTSGQAEFTLEAIDDQVSEGGETVDISGTTAASGIADITGAEITIIDNEPTIEEPTVTAPPDPPGDRIVSGQQEATVTVNLSVDSQTDSGEQSHVDEGDTRTVTVKAALPDGEAALSAAAVFTVTHRGRHGREHRFHGPRLGGCDHRLRPDQRYGHLQLHGRLSTRYWRGRRRCPCPPPWPVTRSTRPPSPSRTRTPGSRWRRACLR